ncbi:MAG: hypothetical protein GWN67_20180 [Phycisphaerae bacterium]|nr:hypothetical protein [Phycisphaerae bacterium]NIP54433.1 hypothetical protein [Phycisphaerae bacterium]NIS53292.1 hypothetical protein [Phycisphaerae bacterium]NIU10818.1 hypothetical protein [Phycisphaerae bacterium]NIU58613.1 hypothetical protein [Phycisphaerae bacterium]
MSNTTNQKDGKFVIRIAIGTLFFFILICSTVLAEPSYLPAITKITDNDYEDTMPQVWGNNVAWSGRYEGGDFEILFWNGSTTIPVSNYGGNDTNPRIWGNNVVWQLSDVTDYEVYFWDGSTTTKITNNDYHDGNPQVWGNTVVWQGSDGNDNEIYLWDGNSTTKITNNSYDDILPQICGNNVVWQGSDGSDYEIFFWDGTTTTRITYNSYDDKEPKISGNNVVWYGKPGGIDGAIFFWDGTDITQITHGTDDKYPEISGNNVTWQGSDGNDFEIYFWDGTAITKVTNNDDWDLRPRISGNNVVWVGEPNDYYKIFFWDGITTTQISDNCSSNVYHRISGNNVVWRGATIYDDYEIFFSHMIPLCHIRGAKWHDNNGNYVQDLDEQGLDGWRIYADLNENGQIDANEPNTLTDINGQYQLAVATDNRTVLITEEQQSCWRQTYPGGSGAHKFSFKPGEIIEKIDFGNARPTETGPSVWHQDEQEKLTSLDNTGYDWFGYSVSISGDYAIMGASRNDTGSAYIFANDEVTCGQWSQSAKLNASDGAAGDFFGESVSISVDYAIVGAPYDDDNGNNSGSAYIFHRNEGGPDNWGQQAKLTASDAAELDYFGKPVCVSGDYAVVGAPLDDDNGANSGSVYIFYRNEGGADKWGQQAKLTASDAAAGDGFGSSVCLSCDHVIVGAWNNNNGQGAAYIFHRTEGGADNWGQQTKLTASDAAANDRLGSSVSISSDYAVVSANYDDDNGENSGSVYIFYRDKVKPANWSQRAKLTASDGAEFDYFGRSVSISGDTILVGASADDDNGANSGSVYVFHRDEGGPDNWGQTAKLTASDGAASDSFGGSVSIGNTYAIVGAHGDDDNGISSGTAYMFGKVLCPSMDVTGDCLVNFYDIAAVANQWLQGPE